MTSKLMPPYLDIQFSPSDNSIMIHQLFRNGSNVKHEISSQKIIIELHENPKLLRKILSGETVQLKKTNLGYNYFISVLSNLDDYRKDIVV